MNIAKEYGLSEQQVERISKIVNDLEAQAKFFDMDVDWEAADLEPKKPLKKLTYWDWYNERCDGDPYFDMDWSKDEV